MPSTGTHDYQAAREFVVSTTGTIDNLDPDGASLILMNNASLSTITGIKAGYAGQIISIISIGAGQVDLVRNGLTSSAANRMLNQVTSAPISLAPGKGTATYQYDNTVFRWRLISHEQGAPINVAFSAGNFTASGSMTWTVESADQLVFSYILRGKIVLVFFQLGSTTVGGVVSDTLRMLVPGGFTVTKATGGTLWGTDNGTVQFLISSVNTGGTVIEIFKVGFANWTLSTDNTAIKGQSEFEVD